MIDRQAEAVSRAKLVLIVVCIVAIVVSFVVNRVENSAQDTHIQKIEPACLRYGSDSKQCHESFGAALEALNAVLTPKEARIIVCRSHLFDALPACRRVHLIEAAEAEPKGASGPLASSQTSASNLGKQGDATSIGNPGHSQPGPHGGGGGQEAGEGGSHHAPAPGEGGSGGAPAPGNPGGSPPSAPPSSSASQSSSSTVERTSESTVVEQPPAEAGAPVKEAVGGVVEEAGQTVTGTVEGVTETTCSLAKVLCRE